MRELVTEVSSCSRNSSFSLSVGNIASDEENVVLLANYITSDWKYAQSVIRYVFFSFSS